MDPIKIEPVVIGTVWVKCFWEVYKDLQPGQSSVYFSDVDSLVLRKSRLPLPEFLEWLQARGG